MSDRPEAFIPGLGTVRECVGCGALVAGGPVRCIRCAKTGDPKSNWTKVAWWKFVNLWLIPKTWRFTSRRSKVAPHAPAQESEIK